MKQKNKVLNKKQIGIGLLELMLSLAIISVLLVMATRYYMSTSLNSRINQTLNSVLGLPAAAECWLGSSSNTSGNYTGFDLSIIAGADKCFPSNMVSGKLLVTPYGNFSVSSKASLVCVAIAIPNLEEAKQLAAKLCKGTTITKSTFYYEAIRQTCADADPCV